MIFFLETVNLSTTKKNSAHLQPENNLPNYQLKQEVPILKSFRGSRQRELHADKYKISKFSTHWDLVSLITLQCLFVIATWEVSAPDTSLSQILLVINQLHNSTEQMRLRLNRRENTTVDKLLETIYLKSLTEVSLSKILERKHSV